jgi:inner membrane protein involved in colicin E2 resistance
MLASFGSLLVLLALVGNVPAASLLCLLAAALFLVVREFSTRHQVSNSLLFAVVFSAVVLPLFSFWQSVIPPALPSSALLASSGLILVVVGLRPFLTRKSGVGQA